jgi:hypothetical protein
MAEKKPVLLRIPQDLYDALARWARDELRSVNAQIEFLLRESVRRRDGPGRCGPSQEADQGNGADAGRDA